MAYCRAETKEQNFFQRLFSCGPSLLDYLWRRSDFYVNRSYNGLLARYLKIDGHAPQALVLPAAAIIFLIYGPTLGSRGLSAILVCLGVLALLYVLARLLKPKHLLIIQLVLFVGLAVSLWIWIPDKNLEIENRLYHHLLILVIPIVYFPLTP